MTAGEALSNYLRSLDPSERRKMSRNIRQGCSISRQVLYNWTVGATPIKPIYRDKINQIVGGDIFSCVAKCVN